MQESKKKILILMKNFACGGIETSALNFIEEMKDYFEIDLFLLEKKGELLSRLPKQIEVLGLGQPLELKNNLSQKKPNKIKLIIKKALAFFKISPANKKYKKEMLAFENKIKDLPLICKKEYDLAISFNALFYPNNALCLKKIKAKKKICIAHSDITELHISKFLQNQISKFDFVCGCSKSCSAKLQTRFNKSKIKTLYNTQNVSQFIEKAKEQCELKSTNLKFGTVARCSEQKDPLRTLKVIHKLNKNGYKLDFYWVGGGELEKECLKFIEEKKIINVHMLGFQDNPYKYIKNFDVFALTSKHEAAPMVYAESMTLGVPVLTTATCSAKELVGENGWVCENSEAGIYYTIKNIIENKEQITEKKKKIKNYKWDNSKTKRVLLDIIEN